MKTVSTTNAPAAIGPYAQGIIVNNMFYSSGQIPLTASGDLVDGDITVQTTQVFENLKAVLAAAGTSLNHVVKTTVFLTDMANFAVLNEVYSTLFNAPFPARSAVAVAALPKGGLVEIEVLAVL